MSKQGSRSRPGEQTGKGNAGHGIITTDGKPFEVPVKGSLGLLALGYRGLMAWRARRIEESKKEESR